MKPIEFKEQNTVYAKDQPEYIPLPACRLGDEFGTVLTCWKFSFIERLKIIFGAKLWWQQLTFRTPLQPVKPTIGDNPLNESRGIWKKLLTLTSFVNTIVNFKKQKAGANFQKGNASR